MVQTPLEKQLDPMGPIASRGPYVDDYKHIVRIPLPLAEFSGFVHGCTLVVCGCFVCSTDLAV